MTDEYSDAKPSEVYDIFFLRVKNDGMDYPQKVEGRSGKWLLFLKEGDELDLMWQKVGRSILEGTLGRIAKVSTMKPNSRQASTGTGVICVYTYSIDDLEDARRVRQRLRDLGITREIPYKLDADVGRYSNQGEAGLSKLYE